MIKLPIWLQASALAFLSCILVVMVGWIGDQIWVIHGAIYCFLPVPVLFLGLRFFFRYAPTLHRNTSLDIFFIVVGLHFILPVLWIIWIWTLTLPVPQRVRESGGGWVHGAKSQQTAALKD